MQQTDYQKFCEAFSMLATVAQAKHSDEKTKMLIKTTWVVLRDRLEIAEFLAGVNHLLTTRREFYGMVPTPAEILDAAKDQASPANQGGTDWAVVLKAITRFGRYEAVDFGPVVNATIRALGGWPVLCSTETQYAEIRRKEFIKLHETYRKADKIDPMLVKPLEGEGQSKTALVIGPGAEAIERKPLESPVPKALEGMIDDMGL